MDLEVYTSFGRQHVAADGFRLKLLCDIIL